MVDGVVNTTVFGMGQSIKITGHVKEGAIAFGGDVIVEGSVDGDVAAIGGSVVQREGSRIGGDVIVLGGIYHHGKAAPGRDPKSVTIMYAGYEDQLRQAMREPFSLLRPQFTAAFWLRVLAILFWFIIALALTAAMPNTVSRAVARLQLTSLRVALIGLLGWIVRHRRRVAGAAGPAAAGWRHNFDLCHSAGDCGDVVWTRGYFCRHWWLDSATLFPQTEIGISNAADRNHFLGGDGVLALSMAAGGCWTAGDQPGLGADGALSS